MASGKGPSLAPERADQASFFTQPSEFTDVILVVERKRLYTSKYFLSALSPVFRTMFTAEFKEKNNNEVKLPGKKYQDVLDLLLYTRPGSRMEMTGNLALRLYPLCHEYEMVPEQEASMKAILHSCEHGIPEWPAFHRACVQLACKYDLPTLYETCVDVAIDNPDTHYDALIQGMKETPADFQTTLVTKLKRTACDHRNGRQFLNTSSRKRNPPVISGFEPDPLLLSSLTIGGE